LRGKLSSHCGGSYQAIAGEAIKPLRGKLSSHCGGSYQAIAGEAIKPLRERKSANAVPRNEEVSSSFTPPQNFGIFDA
jgi:hypothetical protein